MQICRVYDEKTDTKVCVHIYKLCTSLVQSAEIVKMAVIAVLPTNVFYNP